MRVRHGLALCFVEEDGLAPEKDVHIPTEDDIAQCGCVHDGNADHL